MRVLVGAELVGLLSQRRLLDPGHVREDDLGLRTADAEELRAEVAGALRDHELAGLVGADRLHDVAGPRRDVLPPDVVVGQDEPLLPEVLGDQRPEGLVEHVAVGVPHEVHALALLVGDRVGARVGVEVDDPVALGELREGRGHAARKGADHEVDLVPLDEPLRLAYRHRRIGLRVLPAGLDRPTEDAAPGVLLLDGENHAPPVRLAAVGEGAGRVAGEADDQGLLRLGAGPAPAPDEAHSRAERRRALQDLPSARSSALFCHRALLVCWVGWDGRRPRHVVTASRSIARRRWVSTARVARAQSPVSRARRISSCSASDSAAKPPRRACMITR